MKKHCYKKRGSDIYLKSNYATFYLKLCQEFFYFRTWQRVIKSLIIWKKSLKVVNNTPATGISRSLTWQNSQMICRLYYWDKQYASISPLILMAALINCYALLPENVIFFSFLMAPHLSQARSWIFFLWIETDLSLVKRSS